MTSKSRYEFKTVSNLDPNENNQAVLSQLEIITGNSHNSFGGFDRSDVLYQMEQANKEKEENVQRKKHEADLVSEFLISARKSEKSQIVIAAKSKELHSMISTTVLTKLLPQKKKQRVASNDTSNAKSSENKSDFKETINANPENIQPLSAVSEQHPLLKSEMILKNGAEKMQLDDRTSKETFLFNYESDDSAEL